MDCPPNDDNQSQIEPPSPYSYQPPQAPLPPLPEKKVNGCLIVLVVVVILAIIIGISSAHSNQTTQTQSIADQVTKAFDAYTSPPIITSYSADSFLVETTIIGDQAGEAETIAAATSLASDYEKTAWQANITGLSSITVIIVQAEYPVDGVLTNQDLVKCIVTSATGTSLDWNSGTPMQRFQQFDVKWVIGQGTEP